MRSWLAPEHWDDVLFDLIRSEWLPNISFGAQRQGLENALLPTLRGDHDDGNVFGVIHLFQAPDEFQPVHDRHVDVTENQVESILARECQALGSVRGFEDLPKIHARLSQAPFYNLSHH